MGTIEVYPSTGLRIFLSSSCYSLAVNGEAVFFADENKKERRGWRLLVSPARAPHVLQIDRRTRAVLPLRRHAAGLGGRRRHLLLLGLLLLGGHLPPSMEGPNLFLTRKEISGQIRIML